MINVNVIKNKQNIVTIQASGHSGYAESGSDIVCSAVSTLLTNLANGITEIVKASAKVVVDENIPFLSVELTETDKTKMKDAQILMHSTMLSLNQVANEFTKYIKIKEKQND